MKNSAGPDPALAKIAYTTFTFTSLTPTRKLLYRILQRYQTVTNRSFIGELTGRTIIKCNKLPTTLGVYPASVLQLCPE